MRTRVKLCGLRRLEDVEMANALKPDYVGFVFAPRSHRYVTFEQAARLRSALAPGIEAVGVFVNESEENVQRALNEGIIDLAQYHGAEENVPSKRSIKAFTVRSAADVQAANNSAAEHVLLDAGAGSGITFDWSLLREAIKRPYFLAGGLDAHNVTEAISQLHPFAVDVSSGIETDGFKDFKKAAAFMAAVRGENA